MSKSQEKCQKLRHFRPELCPILMRDKTGKCLMKNPITAAELLKKRTFQEYLDLSDYGRKVMPDWFMPMLDDQARNVFYRGMIKGKVKDKVVIDLGSGTGMWSIEALSQGAKFIYIVERNPLLVEYLTVIFKDSPVKIISKPIEELTVNDFDLGTPEVIIHELYGIAGLGEGVIPIFENVWKLFNPETIELIPRYTWLEGRVLHKEPLPLSSQETSHLKENVDLLYELIYPFELKNKVRVGRYPDVIAPHPLVFVDLKKMDNKGYQLASMPVEFKPGLVHTIHVSFKFSSELEGPFFDTYLENDHHWGDAEIEFYVSKSIAPSTKTLTFDLQEGTHLEQPRFID